MKITPILPYSLASLSLLACSAQQVVAQTNIVLLMSDQQRGDALHCMGNDAVISPNLDALANDGTLFTNGYTAAPSSTPARAGLLTGLSPWHHGMLGYGAVAPKYKNELPQLLRNANYFTMGIGKMHWSPQRVKHGFHATILDESGREEDTNFTSDYRQWLQTQAPGVNPDATGVGWNEHSSATYVLPERLHPTAWTGQTACKVIRNYDSKQPLFLKVSFARPHSPYDPPKRFLDLYKDAAIPAPWIGDWCTEYAKLLDSTKHKEAAFGNFGEEYAKESRRHYYANVSFIDEQIGEVIRALKEKGMYENTLIIFVSDHGDMLGDHYHWRKTYPYQGSVHIPYIVKWPKDSHYPKGEQRDQPVELRDVLPTFLTAAGVAIPTPMDGLPLQNLMDGKEDTWREYIDLEHATCYSKANYWCALTNGKIKYVWNYYTAKEELFDLVADPHELHNAVLDADYASQLLDLRACMVRHLSERGEGFVKNGKLVRREKTMLYGPLFPKKK